MHGEKDPSNDCRALLSTPEKTDTSGERVWGLAGVERGLEGHSLLSAILSERKALFLACILLLSSKEEREDG